MSIFSCGTFCGGKNYSLESSGDGKDLGGGE